MVKIKIRIMQECTDSEKGIIKIIDTTKNADKIIDKVKSGKRGRKRNK